MPDLNFRVEGASPSAQAVSPQLGFRIRIDDAETPARLIPAVALRCQIRIEPTRRRYGAGDQERLLDLFGTPERWGRTLRGLLWTHAAVVVPAFTGNTVVELPVPCTFDFNVAATKYFAALEDGEVPLSLLFSGTIFHAGDEGELQVAPISWEKEAEYRLPVRAWNDMMELYYPKSAWICIQKDVFDRLNQYKMRRGLPTWEHALEGLLSQADQPVTP